MKKTRQNGKSIRSSIVVTGAWSLCAIGVSRQIYRCGSRKPTQTPRTSLRLCSVRDYDPGGPVVARSFPAADFAIDACADQTCLRRRAQKQMIDAQAGIAHESIPEVVPKSKDALIRM